LWEGPLSRFAEENQITFESLHCAEIDINHPPKMLDAVLTHLFDNPNLKRISSAIDSSEVLKKLLTATATEAAVQKIRITDTKHALAMLGLNRIGPLLIQGVLSDLLNRFHFPGECWIHARQNCFIQAAKFYGKHNDLVLAEEQSLYATFYLAPFFVDSTVQNRSYQLYRQIKIEAVDAFKPEMLINAEVGEHHRSAMSHLAQQWQLPKLGGEVLRQLIKPEEDKRLANTVKSAVAVLRLAAFHCHTTYNDVDISNPLLQQRLREYLNTLGLTFERFISLQDEFLQQYSPATRLL
jgi:hypothetical protein